MRETARLSGKFSWYPFLGPVTVQIWRRRNNACSLADRTPAFEQDSQSVYWQLSQANRDNIGKKSLLIRADMEKKVSRM